ncbi:MAG: VCBS repeat-containing protein [Planctomycetota bacterium]
MPPGVAHAQVRDTDSDGDPDVAGVTAETVFAAHNDGSGHFSSGAPLGAVLPPLARPILTVADFDSDGDTDVLITHRDGTNVPSILLTSIERQLYHDALATIGGHGALSLRGAPGNAWGILGAARATPTPLGVYGVLRLAAPLVVAATGTFDGTGATNWTFPVPDLVSLVGATLHWQLVTAPPLRLGNREPMQIRGF